jgi:hypothetical protein
MVVELYSESYQVQRFCEFGQVHSQSAIHYVINDNLKNCAHCSTEQAHVFDFEGA